MRKVASEQLKKEAVGVDPEVIAFRAQFGNSSPLDELIRHGAQRMLQAAIETEVRTSLLSTPIAVMPTVARDGSL